MKKITIYTIGQVILIRGYSRGTSMEASSSVKKSIAIVLLILLVTFNLGCFGDPGFGEPAVRIIGASQDVDYDEVTQINLTEIEMELKDEYKISTYPELDWKNGFEARALDHGNETNDAMYFIIYAKSDNGTNKEAKFKIRYWHPIKDDHYIEADDEETIKEIETELRKRARHIAEVANITVDVDDFFFVVSSTD